MTKTQQDRKDRLMPNGIPRWIRCWDAGPDGAIDRYTVVYSGRYPKGEGRDRRYQYVAMNCDPFAPQGFGQHGETEDIIDCPLGWTEQVGRTCRHNPTLGRRIRFEDLPEDCRKLVLSDYHEIWSIPE